MNRLSKMSSGSKGSSNAKIFVKTRFCHYRSVVIMDVTGEAQKPIGGQNTTGGGAGTMKTLKLYDLFVSQRFSLGVILAGKVYGFNYGRVGHVNIDGKPLLLTRTGALGYLVPGVQAIF